MRLFGSPVVRILQHGGIFHDEQVALQRIDGIFVGEALLLGVGEPIAQADGRGVAGRDRLELSAGAAVVFVEIGMDRVAGASRTAAVVDETYIDIGVFEGAVAGLDVAGRQVVMFDA